MKIEINTREHFNVLGLTTKKFSINSSWFKGAADIPTYHLEELMGTKLRALFQRHKGRDLFDLWYAFKHATLSPQDVVKIFYHYLEEQKLDVTRAQFEQSVLEKAMSAPYLADIHPLLAPDIRNLWNTSEAMEVVEKNIFPQLRGEPWKRNLLTSKKIGLTGHEQPIS